ncbi:MAG: ADP-ribosylation factor-like protein [Candidatus Lokiarchaeota archaeon]
MDFTKSNIIKGLLFSAYDKFGPTPIYMFPSFIKNENSEVIENKSDDMLYLTLRDYTQISIKNLSLFSPNITNLEEKQKYYFGIIPHPDFHLTSIVYFSFIHFTKNPQPVQAAISLLVNENKRNFLYNNHERIRKLLEMFFEKLDENLSLGYKAIEEIKEIFDSLFNDLLKIESTPSTPITNQRKMKILFSGLSNSGKTSFLLSVDRKFSKVLNIKPTRGANIQSMNALGSTIFLWDLGGQSSFRSKKVLVI